MLLIFKWHGFTHWVCFKLHKHFFSVHMSPSSYSTTSASAWFSSQNSCYTLKTQKYNRNVLKTSALVNANKMMQYMYMFRDGLQTRLHVSYGMSSICYSTAGCIVRRSDRRRAKKKKSMTWNQKGSRNKCSRWVQSKTCCRYILCQDKPFSVSTRPRGSGEHT